MLSHKRFKEMFKYVPRLTTDVVVLNRGRILLVERDHEPAKGWWAIPGGFVDKGELVEKAAIREVWEETGIRIKLQGLVGVYSDPKRDPRGHVVTVVFLGKPVGGKLRTSKETSDVKYFPVNKLPKLPIDHPQIVKDALKYVATKKRKRS